MTKVKNRTIEDLCADRSILAIQDGNHGEAHPKVSEYVSEGIPFIMSSDIRDGAVRLAQAKRLPKARTDKLRIGFALHGDVLLTHKGTVGEAALAPKVPYYLMLTPQVTYYRTDPEQLDPRYLVFAFRSPFFQTQLKNVSAQSTRPYVSITTQRRLLVPWYPPEVQRRIASILGAYDDLIQLNHRRILLLEDAARDLFDEWFVRFRFPGYQQHSLIRTSKGRLPQGWTIRPLSDIAKSVGESVSPHSSPNQQFLHFSFPAFDSEKLPAKEAGETILSNKLEFSAPCVLIGKLNPRIPRIWYVPKDGALPQLASTEFVPITANKGMTVGVLYSYVNSPMFRDRLRSLSQGTSTSHQRARPHDILAIDVPVPPQKLVAEADRCLTPTHNLANSLREANVLLAQSRDLLLPRLLSGELAVSLAEGVLEKTAA